MLAKALFRSATKGLNSKIPAFQFAKEVEVKSVEGHRAPIIENSVPGQYAGVLFSTASKNEQLYTVLQDMKFFTELTSKPQFQEFAANQSVTRKQLLDTLSKFGDYSPITQQFLNVLVENRRVNFLDKIATKYVDFYKILNKEENIVITSATELSAEQQKQVRAALVQGRGTENFTLAYNVDSSIQGGLTMQCGMEYLDCSLQTRLERLRGELAKLAI